MRSTSVNGEEIFARDKSEIFRNASRFGFSIFADFLFFRKSCRNNRTHRARGKINNTSEMFAKMRYSGNYSLRIFCIVRKGFPVDWVAQSIAREKVSPLSHALSGAILDTTSQVS